MNFCVAKHWCWGGVGCNLLLDPHHHPITLPSIMARKKSTARMSTGGRAPRRQSGNPYPASSPRQTEVSPVITPRAASNPILAAAVTARAPTAPQSINDPIAVAAITAGMPSGGRAPIRQRVHPSPPATPPSQDTVLIVARRTVSHSTPAVTTISRMSTGEGVPTRQRVNRSPTSTPPSQDFVPVVANHSNHDPIPVAGNSAAEGPSMATAVPTVENEVAAAADQLAAPRHQAGQ